MSNRNSTNLLALVAVTLIGSAIASTASANAAHYNVSDPRYSDAGSVVADSGKSPTCYTEPSGFHNSIHWDNACGNTKRVEHSPHNTSENTASSYVEPSGFHHNVRSK